MKKRAAKYIHGAETCDIDYIIYELNEVLKWITGNMYLGV